MGKPVTDFPSQQLFGPPRLFYFPASASLEIQVAHLSSTGNISATYDSLATPREGPQHHFTPIIRFNTSRVLPYSRRGEPLEMYPSPGKFRMRKGR